MEISAAGDSIERPVTTLPGVGPVRAERLARLGLVRVLDLALFVPRGLERQGERSTVAAACEAVGAECSVRVTVGSVRWFRSGRRRSVFAAQIRDETGEMRALFFNQPWLRKRLLAWAEAGEEIELHGRVVPTKSGPALQSPRVGTDERPLPEPGTVMPIYPTTDGVGQAFLRGLIAAVAEECAACVEELVDEASLARLGLPGLGRAIRELHSPADEKTFLAARRRLALEGLLAAQARLFEVREAARGIRAPGHALGKRELAALREGLPHSPTRGQQSAMEEVARDMDSGRPMRRLLQGDVGSGKTLVVEFALALALRTGPEAQAAFLAPTELLAEQHFASLAARFAAQGDPCVLLTGSMGRAEREEAERAVAQGQARVVIGTHALLAERTRFRRLDLLVIDEQQRFGVAQKELLLARERRAHLLLVTATPIPRTLALACLGDLDVSRIDGVPPGRGRRRTRLVVPGKKRAMVRFLGERMAEGERVFWVTPRIEGEDGTAAAKSTWSTLRKGVLAPHGIELVHGRQSAEERDAALARFRAGTSRLLVGTTIVEVGLDVPEATVMVIEGAERFGLAQLHQLRGRVGRGAREAWCFLLAAPSARERLEILTETEDGFRIAEADLARRGMGDIAGSRQAGANVEGLDDPFVDLELVEAARSIVADPELRTKILARGAPAPPALV
ncbi:MAG TPA: ATP-dependent DNA helicase RecG [Planctomycetes bacterium]|nr:ATP-dependent DNA helicase RecG [Planctomycetota bacterium]